MSNIYNIKTPAEGQAASVRGDYGLDNLGLTNLRKVYWNLPMEALYEESIFRGEANISRMGPLVVNTGTHTARAAGDKFVVREATSEENIWWGQYNKPFSVEKFDALFARMLGYFQGRDVFIQDCFGGGYPDHRLPVRDRTVGKAHAHTTEPERRDFQTTFPQPTLFHGSILLFSAPVDY